MLSYRESTIAIHIKSSNGRVRVGECHIHNHSARLLEREHNKAESRLCSILGTAIPVITLIRLTLFHHYGFVFLLYMQGNKYPAQF